MGHRLQLQSVKAKAETVIKSVILNDRNLFKLQKLAEEYQFLRSGLKENAAGCFHLPPCQRVSWLAQRIHHPNEHRAKFSHMHFLIRFKFTPTRPWGDLRKCILKKRSDAGCRVQRSEVKWKTPGEHLRRSNLESYESTRNSHPFRKKAIRT